MIHHTIHSVGFRIKSHTRAFVVSLIAASLLIVPYASVAHADTAPPSGTPATVSVDPLSTPQVNGVVWASAVSGNTVYVTGKFTTATDIDGATYTRNNLLAFDINTGRLSQSFNHSLTGTTTGNCWSVAQRGAQGCTIDVSPNGNRLYVGGSFTTVDGQPRANGAAFDLTTNTLVNGFTGFSNTVRALDSSDTQVFFGGAFGSVNGTSRSRLAAFNADGSLNTAWVANITSVRTDTVPAPSVVYALAVASNQGNLLIGGTFNRISGVAYNALGAVKLSNAALVTPWASKSSTTFPITLQSPAGPDDEMGYTSISYDGTQAYVTAFNSYGRPAGSFEGRAAINPANGNLIWMNDCHGDSYDAVPIGQVLYSVSHAHQCTAVGGFPETGSAAQKRGLAETTYASGTNTANNPSYAGKPKSLLLNWFPALTPGTYTGISQAAWTITGNANYIVLGGEFPRVSGVNQQGLVRFGIKTLAPNKYGPVAYPTPNAIMTYPADTAGKSVVRTYVTGDPDNGLLTYEVYRRGAATPVATKTVDSRFWKATSWTFSDTGVPVGASLDYTLKVKDTFGNTLTMNNPTAMNDTDKRVTYSGSGWTSSQSRADTSGDFARGIHYTKTSGSSYSTTFYGSALTIYGEKASNRGTSTVYIDGANVGTIDQYNAKTVYQQALFVRSGLGFGKHTLKVVKSSDGKYMDVDALAITSSTMLDNRSSAFAYKTPSADWTHRANSKYDDFGKNLSYTKKNGKSYTATFTGTSFAIIGEKTKNRGKMTISVDGGAPVTVTAYSATTKYQQVVYSRTGLAAGTHKVTVTKVDGTYMDVDALEVR